MTRGVTARSLRPQTGFEWLVLLHPADPLLDERRAVFSGARFLYLDAHGTPAQVAAAGYRADWAGAIGNRDEAVAMTRLDDDDGFAPWAMAGIQRAARTLTQRTALMFPHGIRVWEGRWTVVRHHSNAMQTLVTPPGDSMTVYDYLHRHVRKAAPVRMIDSRPAWLWSRHPDTISGWRVAERPLTPDVRALFDVDWSLFGEPRRQPRPLQAGRAFR